MVFIKTLPSMACALTVTHTVTSTHGLNLAGTITAIHLNTIICVFKALVFVVTLSVQNRND